VETGEIEAGKAMLTNVMDNCWRRGWMKCLEKDRTRRYETANGLAMDLQRHLDDEPVIARPPSTAYRFQKLVRRNKLAFAAATGITAALVLGLC
jgi:hypothetical protein